MRSTLQLCATLSGWHTAVCLIPTRMGAIAIGACGDTGWSHWGVIAPAVLKPRMLHTPTSRHEIREM